MTRSPLAILVLLAGCAHRPASETAVQPAAAAQAVSAADYEHAAHLKRHESIATLERMLGLPRTEVHPEAR